MNIIIVDENDHQIGVKEYHDVEHPQDIYRVASLWLTNSEGEVLLGQRAFTKDNGPGLWSPCVNGTVEEGETYESNIVKEIEEEIGVTDLELSKGGKYFRNARGRRYFVQLFEATSDRRVEDFKPDSSEIHQLRWWSEAELREGVVKHPEQFVTYLVETYGGDSARSAAA